MVRGGATWGSADLGFGIATFWYRADFQTFGFPERAVARAGGEGVGNFVQEGVADFRFAVQERQGFGEGDELGAGAATAEAAAGVVELETPAGQTMLLQERPGH